MALRKHRRALLNVKLCIYLNSQISFTMIIYMILSYFTWITKSINILHVRHFFRWEPVHLFPVFRYHINEILIYSDVSCTWKKHDNVDNIEHLYSAFTGHRIAQYALQYNNPIGDEDTQILLEYIHSLPPRHTWTFRQGRHVKYYLTRHFIRKFGSQRRKSDNIQT